MIETKHTTSVFQADKRERERKEDTLFTFSYEEQINNPRKFCLFNREKSRISLVS